MLNNEQHRKAGLGAGKPDPLTNLTTRANLATWLKTLDAETPFPTDLSLTRHDIFLDPPVVFKGTSVTVGANVQLFGTVADLKDIAADQGVTAIKVRFELVPPTQADLDSAAQNGFQAAQQASVQVIQDVDVPLAAFKVNFGQTVVTTTWAIPADAATLGQIRVTIDPNNALVEGDSRQTGFATSKTHFGGATCCNFVHNSAVQVSVASLTIVFRSAPSFALRSSRFGSRSPPSSLSETQVSYHISLAS